MSTFQPRDENDVIDAIRWAMTREEPLAVAGAGSKRDLGRPTQLAHGMSLDELSGVLLYEPEELVLGARAGTPLAEIETLLEERRQMFAFEPADYGPLYGAPPGRQTLGGVISCNISGPRRIMAGAARDHFLGVKAVSGRGESFKSGGRVVKNVTGYDLCKLLAGSYGTLSVMSEITVKVLPAPEKTRTVLAFGLDDTAGVAVLTRALGGPYQVSGAAHLPAAVAARSSVSYVANAAAAVTALRVEGPGPSVDHRAAALRKLLADSMNDVPTLEELHTHNSRRFWREVRDVHVLTPEQDALLWRLSVPPAHAPRAVAALSERLPADVFYDWGGGQVWVSLPAESKPCDQAVRAAVESTGGHATLMRAPAALRAGIPVFQPQQPGMQALTQRLKEGFDPHGVLNPGRMYAGV